MSRFLTEMIRNHPYGYYDDNRQQEGSIIRAESQRSDIPSYAHTQAFWEEAGNYERQRVLDEIKMNEKMKQEFNRNQKYADQRRADGALNSGGLYLEGTLPLPFEEKILLQQKIYGYGLMGGNYLPKPDTGLQTWIPEKLREDLVQQRIQSYEEQTQQAELEDSDVAQEDTEIGQIQQSQDRIGALLRQINTQLIGGLIDKSILVNLSSIVEQLNQYGYAFGVSYLEDLRTQLLEEPGLTEIDYIRGHRRKTKNEISQEGQQALMVAISSYAKDMDRDILQKMVSGEFQNLDSENRKLAMKQIIRDFNQKTASLTEPVSEVDIETRRPQTTNEAIRQILSYLDKSFKEQQFIPFRIVEQYIPLNVEQLEEEYELFTPDVLNDVYRDITQKLRRLSDREVFQLWDSLYRFAIGEEPTEEEYEEGEQQLEPSIEQPGVLPGRTRTIPAGEIPEDLPPLIVPGGEEESKEETEESRQGEFSAEEARASPPPPPRRRPRRPERFRPIEEFFRPATAEQTALAEELGERLAEEEL